MFCDFAISNMSNMFFIVEIRARLISGPLSEEVKVFLKIFFHFVSRGNRDL